MVILFVCMGNVYRSRLAEAYLKSLQLPGITVSSAGVQASKNYNGPITSYAKTLIHQYHLDKFSKRTWTQLTQASLDKADIVVCMNRLVYQSAQQAHYKLPLQTFIWDVADVNQLVRDFQHHGDRIPQIAHKTFLGIMAKVTQLQAYLRRPTPTEQVDIYLADGTATGRQTDINSIHTQGLWHHGVHAAVVTADGLALFQKRSTSIIANPGLWDFTMGGIVATGEAPDQALKRELKEELGLITNQSQIKKLFVWRYNHFLPHYGLHSRVFVNTYLITLEHQQNLRLQASEVSDAKYLSLNEARHFIASGRSHLGETAHTYRYYARLLDAAQQSVQAALTAVL